MTEIDSTVTKKPLGVTNKQKKINKMKKYFSLYLNLYLNLQTHFKSDYSKYQNITV